MTYSFFKKYLLSLILLGGLLRLIGLLFFPVYFSDQDWFLQSALSSLQFGHLPLEGITTSITWLHQGPLWTYLSIPALVLGRFHPQVVSVFTFCLSLVTIPLIFYLGAKLINAKFGAVAAFIYTFWSFTIVHSTLAYHTSPIPLFVTLTFLTLLNKRLFISGLFLGFLYQLHLLTFIFWPPALYLLFKTQKNPAIFYLGFLLGILPFIVSGPVQLLGIFAWAVKTMLGFSQTSGLSVSYQVVLAIPGIFLLSWLITHVSSKWLVFLSVLFIVGNIVTLFQTQYFTTNIYYQHTLSQAIANPPTEDKYLIWWLSHKR